MKYLLFDADTKEYLDAFDEIVDWGFVVKQFQTKDFTLVYRKTHNNDWTHTMFHGKQLDCIKCDGKLEQTDGCNYRQYCETKYKCRQCEIELRMTWNKNKMKNIVREIDPEMESISDDDRCEDIST